MNISLSDEKKLELEKLHGSTRDDRVHDRIKAALLASYSGLISLEGLIAS